jgi:hypothetical protein
MIKSRKMIWINYISRMRVMGNAYKILIGKPDTKRPLGRPSHRYDDNIKTGSQRNRQTKCGVDSFGLG